MNYLDAIRGFAKAINKRIDFQEELGKTAQALSSNYGSWKADLNDFAERPDRTTPKRRAFTDEEMYQDLKNEKVLEVGNEVKEEMEQC